MKRIDIDPIEFGGHPRAFPAHCYSRMKKAGFRLKPLQTIAPTALDVQAAIEPPWWMDENLLGTITVVQDDVPSQ